MSGTSFASIDRRTLLHSNGSYVAHMVVNTLQHGLLHSPELFYVFVGQTTEELEPERK